MIPWVRLAAVGAVLAGAAWGGWAVRDWQADSDELARVQAEQRQTLRRQEAATGAAQTFEEQRDAIRRELLATLPPRALAAPSPQCPAVAVGDLVLPAGSLDRVRAAAGEPGPDADPGGARPAVLPGASAPGR